MKWTEQSPTRVDLAGGTLDLWPLYNFTSGARTINVAIDIKTEATIEEQTHISWQSVDLGERFEYKDRKALFADHRPHVRLLQVLVRELWPAQLKNGFHLMTRSESPVGGGLGGSSSLIVTLIRVFLKAQGRPVPSVKELCLLAHNLEAELLMTPTGTQDYFPAAAGGVNALRYSAQGIEHEVFDLSQQTELIDRFVLVYTGRSHHSGLNNFEVLKSAVGKDHKVLAALQGLKEVADDVYNALKRQEYHRLHSLFERELQLRLLLTPAFSCSEIERLQGGLETIPGTSLKICGAGGGGCVMIWTEPDKRQEVQDLCHRQGLHLLKANFAPPLR